MITYYTSMGRMTTKKENGITVPCIIVEDREYRLTVEELIIWGSLHWKFLNKKDLEREFNRRKDNARIFNDVSFEDTLNRLITRTVVSSGTNYLAADALYELVGDLKIRPVRIDPRDRFKSSVYMYFNKGVPLTQCIKHFFGAVLSKNEKHILNLSKKVGVSTAEIIKCGELKIQNIETEDELMDKLYSDEKTDYITINSDSRFSKLRVDVLQSVANLYLKKQIIFE